jgi:hypothetical protein
LNRIEPYTFFISRFQSAAALRQLAFVTMQLFKNPLPDSSPLYFAHFFASRGKSGPMSYPFCAFKFTFEQPENAKVMVTAAKSVKTRVLFGNLDPLRLKCLCLCSPVGGIFLSRIFSSNFVKFLVGRSTAAVRGRLHELWLHSSERVRRMSRLPRRRQWTRLEPRA